MRLSRKATVVAGIIAAGLATSTPAFASTSLGAQKSVSGSGVLVSVHVYTSATSLQVCGHTDLYNNGTLTGGLVTSVALTTQGAENYATKSARSLTGENTANNVGANTADSCVSFSLSSSAASDAMTFEVTGAGAFVGDTSASSCYGVVARALSGAWIVESPCGI